MSKHSRFDSTVAGTLFIGAALVACASTTGADIDAQTRSDGLGTEQPNAAQSQSDGVLGAEQPNQCGSSVERNLANLAAASAEELGRWEATKDFEIAAGGQTLQLSAEGQARCAGNCELARAILALQDPAAAVLAGHDPAAFASALVAGWQQQQLAEASQAPAPAHQLTRVATEPSACGELFWFDAQRAGCTGDCALGDPESLAAKLVFAGYPSNPYLQFHAATDVMGKPASLVAVDPSGYMPPGGGSNGATCVEADVIYDPTRTAEGYCCIKYNGVVGTFHVSSWSTTTYLCI